MHHRLDSQGTEWKLRRLCKNRMLGQNPAVATKAEKTFAGREKSMMCNRDKLREHKTAMRFEFSVAT
jgi:hypothetical protein